MIGIVIVAHGGLAQEYLATTQHVVGVQAGMVAISIGPEDDRNAKQQEICDAADAVDAGAGVVVVTDLYGGSPSNLSLMACTALNRRIVWGANIPLLIKLAKLRRCSVEVAVKGAIEAGKKYIDAQDVTEGQEDDPEDS